MEDASVKYTDPDMHTSGDSAGIVFWCLIAMALAGITPCLVLPAWRDYQDATVTEQVRAAQLDEAQRELKSMRTRLDAIHNDPVVIARLARRELGFQTPDEQILIVEDIDAGAVQDVTIADSVGLRPPPVQLPAPLARIAVMIPRLDYDRIFCHSPARELILLLSVALFIAAFIIFWPKPSSDATNPLSA